MNDDELIIPITLSYVIVNLIFHIIFFLITISDNKSIKQTNEKNFKLETILNCRIHSFSLILCICLLTTNWLCLGLIYLFPNIIQSCLIQSYFLHVLKYFHLHLTICLRLYWYYCFTFENSCQRITYQRIFLILLFILIYLCLLTLPSISNQWASIIFDKILQICIVNYMFNYSYTFFLLTFTCLIPFILLIIVHKRQTKSLNISQFQYSSFFILIWTFLHILLVIFLHIPIKYQQIRMTIFYIEIISFLLEPILYLFIFRSLSRIILLRPSNQIYFL